MLSETEPIVLPLARKAGGDTNQTELPRRGGIAFDRRELAQILNVYERKVASGEWRDYAIDTLREKAVFSVFRRSSECPLYRIEKAPKLARRQGVYSVIAFFVALRTNEFGIRVALGAGGADIVRMVIGQAGRLVLIGLGVGAVLGTPLLVAFNATLPITNPFDPLLIGSVAAILALTALGAAWIPARRASLVDAAIALRTDA